MHSSLALFVLGGLSYHAQGRSIISTRRTAEACLGTWEELSPIPIIPRQENAAVGINSTTLAVLGGIKQLNTTWNNTDLLTLYDVPSDTWTPASPLPIGLNHPNAAAVDGKIYLLGGLEEAPDGVWRAIPENWVYDPATDEWESLPAVTDGTERGSAAVGVHGSVIYLAGGLRYLELWSGGRHATVDEVSAFDTATGTWLSFPELPLPDPRDHAGSAVVDDTFWVIGGRHLNDGLLTHGNVYALDLKDIEAGWEVLVDSMITPRGGLMAAAVGGLIYTFGGEGNVAEPELNGVFKETEVFDTESRTWKSLAPMPLPRHGTFAVALEGDIYIPGGGERQGPGAVDTLEVFRP